MVGEDAASAPRSAVRGWVFGILRLVAAGAVLAAILTQIIEDVVRENFVAAEYFSYFTIQSAIINVVVLALGGVMALRQRTESQLFTSIRMSTVAYAGVTAVVYEALLRRLPPEGLADAPWPNEVLHVVAPIFIVIDWVFAPGRRSLPWRSLLLAVGYPVAWLAFTAIRGLATGWLPYPFLKPDGPGGMGGVFLYVLGITVFVLAVAATAIGMSRVLGKRRLAVE